MRLLTPTMAQAETRSQRVLQASREKELNDAVALKRKEMAELEAEFQKLLFSQRERWAQEEQRHEESVSLRKQEIEDLEEKRLRVIMPVKNQREEYDKLIQAGKNVIIEYKQKQQIIDRTQEILEVRLDETDEYQLSLKKKEELLSVREKGIEMQEKMSKQNAAFVSESMNDLHLMKIQMDARDLKHTQSLNTREKALQLVTESLELKEKKLEERENRIKVLEIMYDSPINRSPVRK